MVHSNDNGTEEDMRARAEAARPMCRDCPGAMQGHWTAVALRLEEAVKVSGPGRSRRASPGGADRAPVVSDKPLPGRDASQRGGPQAS